MTSFRILKRERAYKLVAILAMSIFVLSIYSELGLNLLNNNSLIKDIFLIGENGSVKFFSPNSSLFLFFTSDSFDKIIINVYDSWGKLIYSQENKKANKIYNDLYYEKINLDPSVFKPGKYNLEVIVEKNPLPLISVSDRVIRALEISSSGSKTRLNSTSYDYSSNRLILIGSLLTEEGARIASAVLDIFVQKDEGFGSPWYYLGSTITDILGRFNASMLFDAVPGKYRVVVSFAGNSTVAGSINRTTIIIEPREVFMNVSMTPVQYNNFKIEVTLKDTKTGKPLEDRMIILMKDNREYRGPQHQNLRFDYTNSEGKVVFNNVEGYSGTSVIKYKVTFLGDPLYKAAELKVSVTSPFASTGTIPYLVQPNWQNVPSDPNFKIYATKVTYPLMNTYFIALYNKTLSINSTYRIYFYVDQIRKENEIGNTIMLSNYAVELIRIAHNLTNKIFAPGRVRPPSNVTFEYYPTNVLGYPPPIHKDMLAKVPVLPAAYGSWRSDAIGNRKIIAILYNVTSGQAIAKAEANVTVLRAKAETKYLVPEIFYVGKYFFVYIGLYKMRAFYEAKDPIATYLASTFKGGQDIDGYNFTYTVDLPMTEYLIKTGNDFVFTSRYNVSGKFNDDWLPYNMSVENNPSNPLSINYGIYPSWDFLEQKPYTLQINRNYTIVNIYHINDSSNEALSFYHITVNPVYNTKRIPKNKYDIEYQSVYVNSTFYASLKGNINGKLFMGGSITAKIYIRFYGQNITGSQQFDLTTLERSASVVRLLNSSGTNALANVTITFKNNDNTLVVKTDKNGYAYIPSFARKMIINSTGTFFVWFYYYVDSITVANSGNPLSDSLPLFHVGYSFNETYVEKRVLMIFSLNDENNLTATIPISMDNQLGIMMRTSTEFYVEKRPVNIIITTNKFSYWKNELVNVTVQVRDVFGLAVKNMQTHLKIYNPKTSYQYYVVDFTNDNGYVSFIWNATSIGKIEISVKSVETSIYYNGSSSKITTVYYGFVSSLANITSHSNYVNNVGKGQQVSVTFQVFGIKKSDNSKVALANYKVNATLIRYEIIKEVKAFNTSQSSQQTGQSARIYDERPSGLGIGRFELPRGLPEPRIPIIIMNSGSSSSSSSSLQNITTWLGIEQIIDRVTLTTDSSGYASYTFTVGDDSSKDYLYYVVLDVLDDYYNYNNDTYYVPNSSSAVAFKTVMNVLRFEIELYKYVDGKWTYTKSYTGSGIYKLKAAVRDFVTFEKLSVNNIHFGFNQSNSYYLMGKNSSVNGEVMFKFDASKYDIKDGNVTFWVWSPDIPSLGSVPIPANSTQGSAQSQTGNAAKLGYSSATAQSNPYYYIAGIWAVKVPYIYLKVTNSFAFHISIKAKLFDPNDKPMPNKKMKTILRLYGGTLEWIIDYTDPSSGPISPGEAPILDNTFQGYTNSNGEYKISMTLNVPPYIKFGTLYVHAEFDEAWSQWWPPLYLPAGTIYTSLTMPVGKWVTILTDVNQILPRYNTTFKSTDKIGWINKTENGKVTPIMKYIIKRYNAKIGNYIDFNFILRLNNTYTDITQDLSYYVNYISDLNNRSDINAVANFYKVYDKRLENELKSINNDIILMALASANIFSRVTFKWIWQLRYHMWDNLGNLGRAMEAYKNDILNSKSVNPLLIASTFISYPTGLQNFLNIILRKVYELAPYSSPAFLYSLTLTTGDYRYTLVAMYGSILSILGSLAIGLNEIKVCTRDLLKKNKEYTELGLSIPIGIIAGAIAGIITANPWIAIIVASFIAAGLYWLVSTYITGPEYDYLKNNTYSPKYLLNLVKLTEYDLSLLKYEIILWDNLRD